MQASGYLCPTLHSRFAGGRKIDERIRPKGGGLDPLTYFCSVSASVAQSAEYEAVHRRPSYGPNLNRKVRKCVFHDNRPKRFRTSRQLPEVRLPAARRF